MGEAEVRLRGADVAPVSRRATRCRLRRAVAVGLVVAGLVALAAAEGTAVVRPVPLALGWALVAFGAMTTTFWCRSQPLARRAPLVLGIAGRARRRAVRAAVARRETPTDPIARRAAWDLARHRVVAGTGWPGVVLVGAGVGLAGVGWGGALAPVALGCAVVVVLAGLLAAVRGPDAMAYLALAEPVHDAETDLDAVVTRERRAARPAARPASAPGSAVAGPTGAVVTAQRTAA